MIGSLLQADFEEIIAAKDWGTLRETLIELPPPDIAELIVDVPPEDEGVIFRMLRRELAAKVFEYIPIKHQRRLVQSLSNTQVHAILNEMTPDDRTRPLDELPAEVTRELGGSEALDAPYFETGLWRMVRKRGGWLAALFLGETLTATANKTIRSSSTFSRGARSARLWRLLSASQTSDGTMRTMNSAPVVVAREPIATVVVTPSSTVAAAGA